MEPAPQEQESPPRDNIRDHYLFRSFWDQQQQEDEGIQSPSESRSNPTPCSSNSNASLSNLNNYATRATIVSSQQQQQQQQKDEGTPPPSESGSNRTPSTPIFITQDHRSTKFVNERNQNILWLKSVLKEHKNQYAILYERTKKFKRCKKTAYQLEQYYKEKNRFTKRPDCNECKCRRVKLSKLKKDLADRMQRIEVTMNAKEDLLKKMRTLDPRIEELKCQNASLEIDNIYLQDNPTLFLERMVELQRLLYPELNNYEEKKRNEERRKEIENQIRIETQEKKEILDDLASVKKRLIDKKYPRKKKFW